MIPYNMGVNSICIITALPAESRVFIDALKLQHVRDSGWRLYAKEHHLLLETGLGKLKAANATGTVLHSHPEIAAVINVGVAGGTQATGTCLQAHKITDAGSGASWYPHLPPQRLTPHLQSTEVLTLDSVSDSYQSGAVFDMEAAGILSAASSYLSTDAIQCIKVISDNAESPPQSFSKQDAIGFMQATVPHVMSLLAWYQQQDTPLSSELHVQALFDHITATTHHTVSEGHQLKRTLYKHKSLTGTFPETHQLKHLTSAAAIRQHLDAQISDVSLNYNL